MSHKHKRADTLAPAAEDNDKQGEYNEDNEDDESDSEDAVLEYERMKLEIETECRVRHNFVILSISS